MAEPFDDSIESRLSSSSPHTGEGIVIDIGTGDGRFVYHSARANPNKFYIGIDANPRPLEKISEKIHRKPAKGGLPNVLFLQAAIEELPSELDGVADEVHVHFPWGSLLSVVASGDENGLRNLRRVCAPDGVLEIIIGLDPERDASEIQRLGIERFSIQDFDQELEPRYRACGFKIIERGVLPRSEWPTLRTTWATRLRSNETRTLVYIIARAASVLP